MPESKKGAHVAGGRYHPSIASVPLAGSNQLVDIPLLVRWLSGFPLGVKMTNIFRPPRITKGNEFAQYKEYNDSLLVYHLFLLQQVRLLRPQQHVHFGTHSQFLHQAPAVCPGRVG